MTRVAPSAADRIRQERERVLGLRTVPSSATDRIREARHNLVLDLHQQRGAMWGKVRGMRARWKIEARREVPPPYRGGVYLPESFGPPPPEEQFGTPEYARWHATYDEWVRDLEGVYEATVPDEARYSRHFVSCGWDVFLSWCVLYDPPEMQLVEFADRSEWLHSRVIPRGERVGDALPIEWIDGEPIIKVRPGTTKRDVLSAFTVLHERHPAPKPPKRRRDPLVAVQCAVLYDSYNGSNSDDEREWTFTYQRLAEMFGLPGWRAAKYHVMAGRELLQKK